MPMPMHQLHSFPHYDNAYLNSPEMAQVSHTSYQHTGSQVMANQQMSASSGAKICSNHGPTIGPFYGPVQMQYPPYYGQRIGPQRYSGPMAQTNAPAPSQQATQMVRPAAPVSIQANHPFETLTQQQQPAANNAAFVAHPGSDCMFCHELPQGPQQQALRELCNATYQHNNAYSCELVGIKVTRDSVAAYIRGDEKKAKADFYRRAQKTKSQMKGRSEKAKAKQTNQHQDLAPPNLFERGMAGLPYIVDIPDNFEPYQLGEHHPSFGANVQAMPQRVQPEIPPLHDTPKEVPAQEDFQQEVANEQWLIEDLLEQ